VPMMAIRKVGSPTPGMWAPRLLRIRTSTPTCSPAATLWYHDHTKGISRLNVYAGLAGLYILQNSTLENQLGLPSGAYDVPLLLQDKSFDFATGTLSYASKPTPGMPSVRFPEFFGRVRSGEWQGEMGLELFLAGHVAGHVWVFCVAASWSDVPSAT